MSNGGNGNGTDPPIPDETTLITRLGSARRVSADGIEASFDSTTEFLRLYEKIKTEEALQASGGGFGALQREIAIPPGTNGGFRYRFGNAYAYRHPRGSF